MPTIRVLSLCLVVVASMACDSVELTIGVTPGSPGHLRVTNANDT